MRYEDLPQYSLDHAHGRIKNPIELWEHRGKTLWFVAQSVDARIAKKVFSGFTHMIPWELNTVAKREPGRVLTPFIPKYEISPDIALLAFREKNVIQTQYHQVYANTPYSIQGIDLDMYNCHGICGVKCINNAVFASKDAAEQYRFWLRMSFDGGDLWDESVLTQSLGIMTISR